jgi:transcription initiation factor TFIID TATA-box-binding protein
MIGSLLEISMKISNIVATVILQNPFDLHHLHLLLPYTELSQKNPWLKMRLPPHNIYIAFYKSGKFLVTGKSRSQIDKTSRQVLSILEMAGVPIDGWIIQIHNLVISDQVEMTSSLERLIAYLDPQKTSYEPEQFPALIYKDWGVSFLLFQSGKMIVSGVKDEIKAKIAIEKFRNLIKGCGF